MWLVYIFGGLATLGWGWLVNAYVEREVGWDNLFFLLPTEIAIFFAAAAVPVAFMWLVIGLIGLAARNRVNRQTLDELARDLADQAPESRTEAKSLTAEIRAQISELESLNAKSAENREAVAALFKENSEYVRLASEKIAAEAEGLRGSFDKFTLDLTDVAVDTANRVKGTMEDTLTSGLASELKDSISKLENQTEKLTRAAKEFGRQIADVENELDAHRVNLAEATARATAQAGEIRSAFSAQAEELSGAAGQAVEKVDAVKTVLDEQIAKMDGINEQLAGRLERIETSLGKQSEILSNASGRAVERAEALEATIQKQIANLGTATESAEEKIKALSDGLQTALKSTTEETDTAINRIGTRLAERVQTALATRIEELDRKTADTEQRIGAISKMLREIVDESIDKEMARVNAAADEAGEKVKTVAEDVVQSVERVLGEQVGQLETAAGKVSEDLATVNATLKAAAEDAGRSIKYTADEAGKAASFFRDQIGDMSKIAKDAAIQTEAVREAVLAGRREAFLLSAAAIIKELNELSVDIDKVFEPTIPDNVMKLYHEGDTGIFVRRIVRTRDAYSIPLVRERMRKDEAFKKGVQTYLKRYETLLARTTECDPDKILTATFLTADIGKVYLLLARANQAEQ